MTLAKNTQGALITGAAKRLGRSMALYLAQQGYDIALHYHHSAQEAECLDQEIQQYGVRCQCFQADLRSPTAGHALMEQVTKGFPRLTVLINNASIYYPKGLSQTTLDDWEQMFAVHLRTPFFLMQQLAQRATAGGLMVNLIDADLNRQSTAYFPYLLSKKALAELTRMAAYHLAPQWRVNGIGPGYMLEPIDGSISNPESVIRRIPLQCQGSPEHIVKALDYLLKNEFVTGQILCVDGGASLGM